MHQELKMLPMGTRGSALRVKMLLMGTQGKKESLDRWWPAVHQSCAQIQRLNSLFFCHWAPTPAPEPSPGLRLCRGIAAALPARNSRASARLLEAAVARSLGPSVGRSRSVVRSLGRSVARSLGSSMKAQVCGLRCSLFRLCFQ